MDNNSTASGVGFCSLLVSVFIVLKLCGVIDWSWLWVLAPIWGPALFVLILALILIVVSLL